MSSSKNAVVTSGQQSVLPLWMRQSFEHLNTKTNLEEYGTSPPENESVYLHNGKLLNFSSMSHAAPKSEKVLPLKTSSLVFRAKELAPRNGRNLSMVPQSTLMTTGDQVCPNSAPQSAANTPSVSPQQSPTLIRKILSADSHCKAGSTLTDSARKVLVIPVTRVTNFDLNAVSPTSW